MQKHCKNRCYFTIFYIICHSELVDWNKTNQSYDVQNAYLDFTTHVLFPFYCLAILFYLGRKLTHNLSSRPNSMIKSLSCKFLEDK